MNVGQLNTMKRGLKLMQYNNNMMPVMMVGIGCTQLKHLNVKMNQMIELTMEL